MHGLSALNGMAWQSSSTLFTGAIVEPSTGPAVSTSANTTPASRSHRTSPRIRNPIIEVQLAVFAQEFQPQPFPMNFVILLIICFSLVSVAVSLLI